MQGNSLLHGGFHSYVFCVHRPAMHAPQSILLSPYCVHVYIYVLPKLIGCFVYSFIVKTLVMMGQSLGNWFHAYIAVYG